MAALFGTDGIRGLANQPPITAEMGVRLGRSVVAFCRRNGSRAPSVLIGRDTRQSGAMLEHALVAGVLSAGGDALTAGVLPTPGIAYLTRQLDAAAGIVVSASHNPYDYNGFKVFSGAGMKLSDAEEEALEELLQSPQGNPPPQTGSLTGKILPLDRAARQYAEFLKQSLADQVSLKNLKVVIDCANGAASTVAPALFEEMTGEVQVLHATPDGTNINHHCGSQYPQDLSRAVLEKGADAGLAFDGDADRLIAVDETGRVLSGDQILTVCAAMLKKEGTLEGDTVVSTVMSNCGLGMALRQLGIRHVTSPVGDRQVLATMVAEGAVLGGEDSGHMIFLRRHTTGDGLLSALQLLKAIKVLGAKLSELAGLMRIFPQHLLNVPVARKPRLEDVPAVQAAIRKVETDLGSRGRVLVRYSGTEPLCRVMVEGEDLATVEAHARRIASVIHDALA